VNLPCRGAVVGRDVDERVVAAAVTHSSIPTQRCGSVRGTPT
jgi:hypothetical protein